MIIIIGLGNLGEQYKNTRHNVGFMAVDEFAKKNNFPDFKFQKKFEALISEKPFDSAQGDEKIILVKPQTFMNESGKAVKRLISNTDGGMANLVIIHDDIDLPIGKIKIVKERGSAGHKGVESIIKSVGNGGLIRLRVGISPENKTKAMKVVLKNFSADEQEKINEAIQNTIEALNMFIKDGLDKAMNSFNA